jgi:hypothetical protein
MHYVYALIDPVNKLPFYIGKGKNKRAWSHLKGHANYNEDKLNYIDNIRLLGHEPDVVVVKDGLSNHESLEWERDLIEYCKKSGIVLTNKDSVPPDRTGSTLSNEHKEILRAKNIGKTLTDEHKKKIGLSNSHKPNVAKRGYIDTSCKRNEGSKNPRAQKIKVCGVIYNCKKHACQHFGVSRQTFEKHYKYSKL